MMPYTDYTVRLGDLKRAIMKNPYDPNLNIDGYMRYLKYNTPSAQPEILACGEGELNVADNNVGDMINRQMAIDAIHEDADWLASQGSDWQTERMERDKSILKSLPSAQPDRGYIEQIKWERDLAIRQLADLGYGLGEKPRTNGDIISRQAAIDELDTGLWGKEWDKALAKAMLESLPSAERKGKWINHRNDGGHNIADCSECGSAIQWFDDDEKPRFCCMCGADMRGEEND